MFTFVYLFVAIGDSLYYHYGMKFSTKDQDNDHLPTLHCAQDEKGAWWYNGCSLSNLNGQYFRDGDTKNTSSGIIWDSWKGVSYSLKSVVMKMNPYPRYSWCTRQHDITCSPDINVLMVVILCSKFSKFNENHWRNCFDLFTTVFIYTLKRRQLPSTKPPSVRSRQNATSILCEWSVSIHNFLLRIICCILSWPDPWWLCWRQMSTFECVYK